MRGFSGPNNPAIALITIIVVIVAASPTAAQFRNHRISKRFAEKPIFSPKTFNYLVPLRNNQNKNITTYCNGVMITPTALVTSANCATLLQSSIWMNYGSTNFMTDRKHLYHEKISSVLIHPNYTGGFENIANTQYNIALMFLDRPVPNMPFFKPVDLPKKGENLKANNAVLASWSVQTSTHKEESIQLANRKVRMELLEVLTEAECEEEYEFIPPSGGCVKTHSKDSLICIEDLGAPVLIRHIEKRRDTLFGLLNYAPKDCFNPHEGFTYQFTRIDAVLDWLRDILLNPKNMFPL